MIGPRCSCDSCADAPQATASQAEGLEAAYIAFLTQLEYQHVKVLPGGRWAALHPFVFTAGIVQGTMFNSFGCYDDRWCYHDMKAAQRALDAWDGTGEPQGWHRHPTSGRRRPDGDPAQEYRRW